MEQLQNRQPAGSQKIGPRIKIYSALQTDYDPYFYKHLAKRARRIYLFRNEYMFDLVGSIAVETPKLGHATYLFARPRNIEEFLGLYAKVSKEDIRKNRNNIAEALGFVKRIVHGTKPRAWANEIDVTLGEPTTPAEEELMEP